MAGMDIDWWLMPIILQPHKQWYWVRPLELSGATGGCGSISLSGTAQATSCDLRNTRGSPWNLSKGLSCDPHDQGSPLVWWEMQRHPKCPSECEGNFSRWLCRSAHMHVYTPVLVCVQVWTDCSAPWQAWHEHFHLRSQVTAVLTGNPITYPWFSHRLKAAKCFWGKLLTKLEAKFGGSALLHQEDRKQGGLFWTSWANGRVSFTWLHPQALCPYPSASLPCCVPCLCKSF